MHDVLNLLMYCIFGVVALVQLGVFLLPRGVIRGWAANVCWEASFIHLCLERKTYLYGICLVLTFVLDMMGHWELAVVAMGYALLDIIMLCLATKSYGLHCLAELYRNTSHFNPNTLAPFIPNDASMLAKHVIETAYWKKTQYTIAEEDKERIQRKARQSQQK